MSVMYIIKYSILKLFSEWINHGEKTCICKSLSIQCALADIVCVLWFTKTLLENSHYSPKTNWEQMILDHFETPKVDEWPKNVDASLI